MLGLIFHIQMLPSMMAKNYIRTAVDTYREIKETEAEIGVSERHISKSE